MKDKIAQFGKLAITTDGDIYNMETERLLSLFEDAKGNPVFRSPDTRSNFRVDYIVAMMFLNNGELIEKITDYYIEHLDGDIKNCKLSNLRLITDKKKVKNLRFGYLTGNNHVSNYERKVLPVYVADKERCAIDEYTINEFCKKFGISSSCAVKKAKNCERIYKDNFKLYVCETMYDAFYCL